MSSDPCVVRCTGGTLWAGLRAGGPRVDSLVWRVRVRGHGNRDRIAGIVCVRRRVRMRVRACVFACEERGSACPSPASTCCDASPRRDRVAAALARCPIPYPSALRHTGPQPPGLRSTLAICRRLGSPQPTGLSRSQRGRPSGSSPSSFPACPGAARFVRSGERPTGRQRPARAGSNLKSRGPDRPSVRQSTQDMQRRRGFDSAWW